MAQIITYLTFNGNCRQAMEFYQSCLGGELRFQPVSFSPSAGEFPNEMKDIILHASLMNDKIILMGTDLTNSELVRGNAVSMLIQCESEEEIKGLYQKLSIDGKAGDPLQTTAWGALFGTLTDRYGNHWLLNFNDN